MKKLLVVVLFIVLMVYVNAQPVWQWQNPNPPMSNFQSISMIDTTEGWMTVGTNSLMHYTGGQWNLYNVPPGLNMINPSSVFFISHTLGWVSCQNGIYRYNGFAWQIISGTNMGAGDLFFFNQNNGWALGNGGTILKLTGLNSVVDTVIPRLRAINFPDSLHGWAVGDSGKIMSYYGGFWYNWPLLTTHDLHDVYFTDLYHGWAVGDSGTVLYFNGTSWQLQNSNVGFNILTLDFTDPMHGFAAGFSDTIITYDGTSWSFYCTAPSYILSIDMVNPNRGFASCYMGIILDITNTATAVFSTAYITGNELNGVSFSDIHHGWAVGREGTMLTYLNGNWSALYPEITNADLSSVSFPDSDHGWCVGEGGTIINYNHGVWNGEISGTGNFLYSVHFVDSLNGWAVGQDGVVLRYHNNVWSEDVSNTDTTLLSVFFTDTTNGWAVGTYGNIIHYSNGVWQHYNNTNHGWFNSVYFTSQNDGWAVGDSGFIWHYNGFDWQVYDTVAFAPWKFIRSVYFTSPDNGWIVGMQSLYHFDGYNWTDYSYTLPSGYQYYSIAFPDVLNGWIVGGYGSILYCFKPTLISNINSDVPMSEVFDEVYPNPCEEKCFYIFNNNNLENIKLKVYGVSGQEYQVGYSKENSYDKTKLEINVSELEPGLYFLTVNTEEKNIIKKIIRK